MISGTETIKMHTVDPKYFKWLREEQYTSLLGLP